MIHPHDDEPDPTAYMGNYNFPQMLFAFCVGFCTMFVLAVDEINDFKGCPVPEYFLNKAEDEFRREERVYKGLKERIKQLRMGHLFEEPCPLYEPEWEEDYVLD